MHWPARILTDPHSLARAVRRYDETYTTATEDERLHDIAEHLGADDGRLVAANRVHLRGLRADSVLGKGTVLLVPQARSDAPADDSAAGCGEPAAPRKKRKQRLPGQLVAFSCSGLVTSCQGTGTTAVTALCAAGGESERFVTGDEDGCVYLRRMRGGDRGRRCSRSSRSHGR